MSNNLFRKGLVAAAISGLAATAFAGTPAFAAPTVSLVPFAGTSYTLPATETFALSTLISADTTSSNYKYLAYKVVATSGQATATATLYNGANNAPLPINDGALNNPSTVGYTVNASDFAATATQYVKAGANSGAGITDTLRLYSGSTDAASSYSVTAFLDTDETGNLSAGDSVVSTPVTVNFIAAASVTGTVALTSNNNTGDQVVAAKVNLTNVNQEQIGANNVKVQFNDGTGAALAGTSGGLKNAAWVSADAAFETGDVAATALVKGNIVNAQAKYKTTAVGTSVNATVADKAITALAGAVVKSASAQGTTTASLINDTYLVSTNGNKAAYKVLTNGAFTVKATATTTDSAPVAGRTVTFTVYTGATLSATAGSVVSITVNGTTYNTAAALTAANTAGFKVVTDAKGEAALNISTAGFVDGKGIKVVAAEEGFTSTVYAVAQDAAYTATVASGAAQSIAIGGTATATLLVVDQFGTAVADGYDVIATPTASTGTAPATFFGSVVGGKATLSLADSNGTSTIGARTLTYAIDVAKRSATTGNYVSLSASGSPAVVVSTVANVLDFAPATIVPGSATVITTGGTDYVSTVTGTKVETVDFAANDPRIGQGASPVVTSVTSNNVTSYPTRFTVSGDVSSVSSATHNSGTIVGAKVTVSKAGTLFNDPATGVWALDSITVETTTSGIFKAYAYSHVAGDQVVSIASGAAVASVKYTVAAPLAAAGAKVIVTAPETARPGTTITVSAKVVDKFGNTVGDVTTGSGPNPTYSLTVAGIGAGFTHTSLTAGTETNYITLGASDIGTLTVTGSWDVDGTATTNAAVVDIKSIKVGLPTAAKTALAVGADQAQVGAAVDVIATATDAAGKPAAGVVVTFDNVGQGYLSAASATTDANGVAKVKLVGNVAGRNTLTATANGATAANAGVSFGAADANISVKGKRATVTYEFAGLAKVVVSVNGVRKPAVYPADDNEGTFSFNLKAGTNKIVVSIAGKTVDSKTVKIKK